MQRPDLDAIRVRLAAADDGPAATTAFVMAAEADMARLLAYIEHLETEQARAERAAADARRAVAEEISAAILSKRFGPVGRCTSLVITAIEHCARIAGEIGALAIDVPAAGCDTSRSRFGEEVSQPGVVIHDPNPVKEPS